MIVVSTVATSTLEWVDISTMCVCRWCRRCGEVWEEAGKMAADIHRQVRYLSVHDMCVLWHVQVKVTKKHTEDCKTLLKLMGVPYVEVRGGWMQHVCVIVCGSLWRYMCDYLRNNWAQHGTRKYWEEKNRLISFKLYFDLKIIKPCIWYISVRYTLPDKHVHQT